MKNGCDIAYVYHDEDDHGWQFHYNGEKNVADCMVVALEEIVVLDSSVLEVADIPPGWMASREEKGAPWKRAKQ